MTPFDAFSALADQVEGQTLDRNPADRGNWTGGAVGAGELRGSLRGVSAAAYPTLDIATLTDAQIRAIRRVDYWSRVAGDDLAGPVAVLLADEAFNQGVSAAVRDMQAAVSVPIDGVLGPVTVHAANQRPADDLLAELIARRSVRYATTSTFPTFGLGWSRRLAAAARTTFRL